MDNLNDFAKTAAGICSRAFTARHNAIVGEYEGMVSAYDGRGEMPEQPTDKSQFKTGEAYGEYEATRALLAERLHDAAQDARAEFADKVGAPSAEALAAIQMMNLQPTLTKADVDAAMSRYGSQLDCYRAIKGMAERAHVPFAYSHPAEATMKRIDAIEQRAADFLGSSAYSLTSDETTSAIAAITEMAAE